LAHSGSLLWLSADKRKTQGRLALTFSLQRLEHFGESVLHQRRFGYKATKQKATYRYLESVALLSVKMFLEDEQSTTIQTSGPEMWTREAANTVKVLSPPYITNLQQSVFTFKGQSENGVCAAIQIKNNDGTSEWLMKNWGSRVLSAEKGNKDTRGFSLCLPSIPKEDSSFRNWTGESRLSANPASCNQVEKKFTRCKWGFNHQLTEMDDMLGMEPRSTTKKLQSFGLKIQMARLNLALLTTANCGSAKAFEKIRVPEERAIGSGAFCTSLQRKILVQINLLTERVTSIDYIQGHGTCPQADHRVLVQEAHRVCKRSYTPGKWEHWHGSAATFTTTKE
jgi:hypothetical protein